MSEIVLRRAALICEWNQGTSKLSHIFPFLLRVEMELAVFLRDLFPGFPTGGSG